MMTLIAGTPGSGKSALAESLALERSEPEGRIYLATMIPAGKQGLERIERHRRMRAGKGFRTVEAPFDAARALRQIPALENRLVLLECVSNLLANELFERGTAPEEAADRIFREVVWISENSRDLIAVTSHFEQEPGFDEETRLYAEWMDRLNDRLREAADQVIER